MSDIHFCSKIQGILAESGFASRSIASDEDGYSHAITFSNGCCKGEVNTEDGKIVRIVAADLLESDNWQPFEEYEKRNKVGPCWIVYKGDVVKAYRSKRGLYWNIPLNCIYEHGTPWVPEQITHCMDEIVPQPPID